MKSEQFVASGRSITLECRVCGSPDVRGAKAGSPCAVCAEGKLRWRLHAANRESRAIQPNEFAGLRAREKRIERMASAAPDVVRELPLDPNDALLDVLEEGTKPAAQPARAIKPRAVAEPAVASTVSPFAAAVASLILPGLGQILAGRIGRGAMFLGLLLVFWWLLGIVNVVAAIDAYQTAAKVRRGHG